MMKKKLQIISLSVLGVCFAYSIQLGNQINISSSEVPSNRMLADLPYMDLTKATPLNHLNNEIKHREMNHTFIWLKKAVSSTFLPSTNQCEYSFLSNVGKNKDDALVLSWKKNGFSFTAIDTRFFILIIEPKEKKVLQLKSLFKEVVSLDCFVRFIHINQLKEDLSKGINAGEIVVDRGPATGWFKYPIEYYKTNNSVILVFNKTIKPTPSKIQPKPDQLFDGLPFDDKRAYLRFENSNRKELSQERFKAWYDKKFKKTKCTPKIKNPAKQSPKNPEEPKFTAKSGS